MRGTRFGWAVAACAVTGLALVTPAHGDRAFAPRFAANVTGGDIAIAANALMTCPAAAPTCAAAQAGTATGSALSNNAYSMVPVDVDADATTFSSSRARLDFPSGAEVLFAGLYYGARTSAGAGGSPAPSAALRGAVKLAVPGGGYQTLAAAVDDSAAISASYQGFVDVTPQVRAAGAGSYTVADVQAGTGVDRYAGWALVVAYRDDAQPPRNLSVFDGLRSIEQGDPPLEIAVSGFETPSSGAVRTRAGFVVYEGDRGGSGDRALLNGRLLADAANPANNFFNSTISVDGVNVTTGEPSFVNQLGFDAILTAADGYLVNGDTEAEIELSTTLDQYLPGAVTFATELNPAFLQELTVENEAGDETAKVGEKVAYQATITNQGAEPANEVELTSTGDGPVRVVAVRSAGDECEIARQDSWPVECELGSLAPGAEREVVVVVRPLETGPLVNTATVSVEGADVAAASATTSVKRGRAQLALTKSASRGRLVAGERVRFEIVARARGKASAVDLRICDRLPDGLSVVRARRTAVRGDRACWRVGELAPGDRRRFALTAKAEPVPGKLRLRNVATAEGVNVPREKARAAVVIAPGSEAEAQSPCKAYGAPRRC